MSNGRPVSSGSRPGVQVGMFLFSALFVVVGAVVFYTFTWPELQEVRDAKQWDRATCEIVTSEVMRHSGESTTYSVAVTYHYFFNDVPYRGDRYEFFGGSSTGYDGKAAVVARLRPGTRTECWVNPANPQQSVIDRRAGFGVVLFGLLPLIFVVAGGCGMYIAVARGGVPFGRALEPSATAPTTRPLTTIEAFRPRLPSGPGVARPSRVTHILSVVFVGAFAVFAGNQAARWEFVMAPGGVEVTLGS